MHISARNPAVAILFILAAGNLASCADLKALFGPKAPPPSSPKEVAPPLPPRTPKEATPPLSPGVPKEVAPPATTPKEKIQPPVLSPKVATEDAERLKQESTSRIQQTEEILKPIDQTRLTKSQQETFATIQSFLTGARQALGAQDYLRASNLANKAHVLAEEISRSLQ